MLGSFLVRIAQLINCQDGISEADRANGVTIKCNTTLPQVTADSGALQTILTIVFGSLTAVAVLIIVVQGIKFVLSQGEPDKTAQARKGIIYAAAGLIIVFTADIFVAFFLKRII